MANRARKFNLLNTRRQRRENKEHKRAFLIWRREYMSRIRGDAV